MQTINNITHPHFKSNPFRVPNGYFDSLPVEVGQKIDFQKRFSFRRILGPQLALAASFALMITLGYGIIRLITPNESDSESIYIENISMFNSYTLLHDDEWDDNLDAEQIITFLTEHGVSPHLIASLE